MVQEIQGTGLPKDHICWYRFLNFIFLNVRVLNVPFVGNILSKFILLIWIFYAFFDLIIFGGLFK